MTTGETDVSRSPAERWALVTARDIMRKNVVTVNYATPLSDVERKLSDHRISGAPVTDEAGHIVGVISIKDLISRYAENADAQPRRGAGYFHLSSEEMQDEDFSTFQVPAEAEETAGQIMSGDVFSVSAAAGLSDIAKMMVKHRVHRLLVEEGGKYVGLISTLEILDALSS